VEDNTEMELMERCGDVNEIESFVMQQWNIGFHNAIEFKQFRFMDVFVFDTFL
jgi:hypothetical protein